jgi:ABC-type sugar transport system permease subunit
MIGFEKRRALTAYGFVGPWLVGFLVFSIFPLAFSLYASLCKWSFAGLEWAGVGNYVTVFSDIDFWRCGITTVLFGLVSTPITLSFALLLALLINQKIKGIRFFRALYFLPVVAASDVISTTAGSILFRRVIVFNIDLSRFGIVLSGQGQFMVTIVTMLLTLGLWRTGIQMLIFLMGLSEVPHEYYEAADMDGATGWQKFWWVTIPSISPLILLNMLLTIVESFTGLATIMQIITGGHVQLFIWDYVNYQAYSIGNWGAGLAVVWVFILVLLAIIGLIYRMMNRKVSY